MSSEKYIDEIVEALIKTGSQIDYIDELKQNSLSLINKDIDLDAVLGIIASDIKRETEKFLNQKNDYDTNFITGISTCIYLPDFSNRGEYKLKIIGGKGNRCKSVKIKEDTLFDVASITKLYTLVLLFGLEKHGLINLNEKIKNINPDFQGLGDYTLNDLVRLHGDIKTHGNIKNARTEEEAYSILKTMYLESSSRLENKYTDFGAIVIGDTIAKVISKLKGEEYTFEEVMYEYLLTPLNLHQTYFNPLHTNIAGNGNKEKLVHDPKARILGGALGHAGIFVSSDDLAKFAKELYKVSYYNRGLIRKISLDRLGEVTFPNSNESNRGNLGMYVKHPMGYDKTFTPPEFSTGSFSSQGYTGSLATFDPNNFIHQNILVSSIYENEDQNKVKNDKPVGFMEAFNEYQLQITKNTMLMFVAKQYYNKYCKAKENIDVIKYI